MNFPQNAYPNFTNFQEVSFPQEVTPPDVEPDADVRCVKYNPAWAKVLAAACNQLTQLSAWKGTDDEKKLAVMRATNLKAQLQDFEECDMGCCGDPFGIPVLHRVTDDGTMQISRDGGTTWVDDATDPRLTQVALPPITGTGNLSCQAASNIVAAFKPIIHDLSVLLTGTVALLALAVDIAGIIAALIFDPADAYRIVPVVLSFAENLVSETETEFFARFTDTIWHDLLCAIQCTIGGDGIYTGDEITALRAKMADLISDAVVLNAFNLIITGVGVIGMNNFASQSATEEDCSDCGCVCDTSLWDAYPGYGTSVSRGTDVDGFDFIEADAELHGSNYYIIFTTGDANVCCEFKEWTTISGDAGDPVISWCLCGETPPTGECHSGLLGSGSINSSQMQKSGAFRGRLTFVG